MKPREFRYWDHLDKPHVRRLRAVTRALLGFDPAPPDEPKWVPTIAEGQRLFSVGDIAGAQKKFKEASEMGPQAAKVAAEHRASKKPLPGFGHPEHKPDDPRPPRIFDVMTKHAVPMKHVEALKALSRAVDAAYGKHITINATGAVAAALLDLALPAEIMRGFAVLARCAGLVGHILEEMRDPSMRAIWEAAEKAVPYSEG